MTLMDQRVTHSFIGQFLSLPSGIITRTHTGNQIPMTEPVYLSSLSSITDYEHYWSTEQNSSQGQKRMHSDTNCVVITFHSLSFIRKLLNGTQAEHTSGLTPFHCLADQGKSPR